MTEAVPELALLIGLQASGKTTFYETCMSATHVHVSKDRLRNAKRKDRRQAALIAEALASGRSVAVDNTNASAEERRPLIELARSYGAALTGYYFPSSVKGAIARNARRQGRSVVPLVAIFATAKRLQEPSLTEGFDQLFSVRIFEEGHFEVRPWTGPGAPGRRQEGRGSRRSEAG